MSVLQALVLGVVQGLTEFLPVSSSAHLVLVPELLGWEQPSLPYLVLLHAATLLALLVYFRRELLELATGVFRPGPARKLVLLLAVATVPAALIGFIFESQFERSFGQPFQVAIQLVLTGVILIAAELLTRRRPPSADDAGIESMARVVTAPAALSIGLAQALAIVPGISRSGSTIGAGLLAGMSRSMAARFSFLMSIPILLGASLFEVPKLAGASPGPAALVAGFLGALVSGYLSIAGMVAFLQRRSLMAFAGYCIVAGALAAMLLR
ncbi:MAG: undecaprenyl-diphosphate phosphatase [Actinomycetota bacterium]